MDVKFLQIVLFCGLLLVSLGSTACGGEDGPSAVQPIEGSYAMVFGAQQRTFSLKPTDSKLTCRPKPGLSEFALEAADLGEDGQSSINLALKGYSPDKQSWDQLYDDEVPRPDQSTVEVLIAGGYKYGFFQALRIDIDQKLNSHCKVQINSEEQGNKTHYQSTISCTMLWADFSSKDHNSETLNSYIDLLMKFECDY